MKLHLTVLSLLIGIASSARADDTPFLVFQCRVSRAIDSFVFELKFKNDESKETLEWSSILGRTNLTFHKMSKRSVHVTVTTGAPVVAHAVPEEFRFTAALDHDDFGMAFGIKPLAVKGDFFSLKCVRDSLN